MRQPNVPQTVPSGYGSHSDIPFTAPPAPAGAAPTARPAAAATGVSATGAAAPGFAAPGSPAPIGYGAQPAPTYGTGQTQPGRAHPPAPAQGQALAQGRPSRSGVAKRGKQPPHERVIATMHKHAWRTVLPSLVLIATALAGTYLVLDAETTGMRLLWLGISIVVALGFGLLPLLLWRSTVYRVTTVRVVTRTGFPSTSLRELPVQSIVDVVVRQNPLQSVRGSGDVFVTAVNGHRLHLRDVPRASLVASAIRELSGA